MLGIITARGGSKRVPRKNIKDFLGKPLLTWSVEVGKASGVLDRFILSTEDDEIAEVGRKAGIEVPFKRPEEFATDTSSSLDVIKHAITWLKDNDSYTSEWIILLEPSAPGRQPFHIQEVAKLIKERGQEFDSVVGISKTPGHFSPYKALIQNENGLVTRTDSVAVRDLTHRNQDVAKTYYINSNIYAFKSTNLFDPVKSSLWGARTLGYLMDSKYAIDIDTPEDWEMAEFKMGKLLK